MYYINRPPDRALIQHGGGDDGDDDGADGADEADDAGDGDDVIHICCTTN